VVVSHVTQAFGPTEALSEYLSKNIDKFTLITHPLYNYSGSGYSSYQIMVGGQKSCKQTIKIPPSPEFLHYLFSFIFSFWFLLKSKKRYDLYIGVDNLNALVALFLKKIGIVNKVVFYVADYSEHRFKLMPLNLLYNWITQLCAKNADVIWSISLRASRKLKEEGANKEHTFVVPNGVNFNKIPKHEPRKSGSIKRLIFVGHLTQTKGVADFLKQFPDIIQKFKDVKLFIVGTGPYETQLKELTQSLNLQNYVEFLGYMQHDDLLKLLPTFDIGLAPYTFYDDYVKFCDPVKVKEYLACGCAVIISNVPEISLEISSEHAGLVYADFEELKNCILLLLKNDAALDNCRRNALKLSKKYDWANIFDRSFSLVGLNK
jgi:glycosyltransferase involved in cell wall biosynthesis